MATEVPSFRVDLNYQWDRGDGKWVTIFMTDEILELRQTVILEDDDVRCLGIVCGFKDHGRGEFYEVEVGDVID